MRDAFVKEGCVKTVAAIDAVVRETMDAQEKAACK
jgi:hypothetical protein